MKDGRSRMQFMSADALRACLLHSSDRSLGVQVLTTHYPRYSGGSAEYIMLGIMSQEIDPLDVQFHLTHDCIRACVYADHIGRLKPKAMAWPSICDMLYADTVISWNALFGTATQETHWRVFTKDLVMPSGANLKPFGCQLLVSLSDR